jgi:flagellar basal body rod protein FlgB
MKNSSSLITDNISEVLVKIIEFTKARHEIISENLSKTEEPDFVPRDLAVEEFSGLLQSALNEHIQNRRIVLFDSENIKFDVNSRFKVKAIADTYAKELFEKNKDEYIKLQVSKLMENSLNHKVAAEILRQKKCSEINVPNTEKRLPEESH